MQTVSWNAFKQMAKAASTVEEILGGPCLQVTLSGVPQFYVVVKPEQGMIARVEGMCSQIDASRGR